MSDTKSNEVIELLYGSTRRFVSLIGWLSGESGLCSSATCTYLSKICKPINTNGGSYNCCLMLSGDNSLIPFTPPKYRCPVRLLSTEVPVNSLDCNPSATENSLQSLVTGLNRQIP